MFFEDKAEEDNDISEGEDEDAERTNKLISKEDQYYDPEKLRRRAPGLDRQFVDRMEVAYKPTVQEDDDLDGQDHLAEISDEYD